MPEQIGKGMSTIMHGSIEIDNGQESAGIVGTSWVISEIPVVLRNLHGITGMVAVTPQKRPTGRTPANQWTGKDTNNQNVVVMFWPDPQ